MIVARLARRAHPERDQQAGAHRTAPAKTLDGEERTEAVAAVLRPFLPGTAARLGVQAPEGYVRVFSGWEWTRGLDREAGDNWG